VAHRLKKPWRRWFEQGPSEAPHIASVLRPLRLRVLELGRDVNLLEALDAIADADGVPVVVLDYLQDAARRVRPDDLYAATAFFTDELREWTMRAKTVVLALSSVGRGHYQLAGREGTDLVGGAKNAGEVEYDASAVLHLETEPCPLDGSAPAKLHVAKARFGSAGGVIGLRFHGALGTFEPDTDAALSDPQLKVLDAVRQGLTSAEDIGTALKTRKDEVIRILAVLQRRRLIDRRRGHPIRLVEEHHVP